MFSAKDEKNSLGATLWFNIAHYAMRSWPWILTGLVAVAVYSPHGGLRPSMEFAAEPEKGYVMVLRDFLPPALRGLMVAAFLAAFMSTVGTQLNWGTSYLINDLYRRFLVRKATDKHYVFVSKVFIVMLVILSGYAAANINSIQSAWQLLLGMGAGTGSVLVLRWYWWRINAWSEISAMIAAFVVSISLQRVHFAGNDSVVFAKAALITTITTTVVWLRDHLNHQARIRRTPGEILPPRATHGDRLAANRRARSRNHPSARPWRQHLRLDYGLHAGLLLHVRDRRAGPAGMAPGICLAGFAPRPPAISFTGVFRAAAGKLSQCTRACRGAKPRNCTRRRTRHLIQTLLIFVSSMIAPSAAFAHQMNTDSLPEEARKRNCDPLLRI